MDDISTKLALIGVLGVSAQWLAWRFRMPAIVLLSIAGILAGPVFGVLDPRADFGDLLKPIIGLAVAIILFEGGITLNFSEIKDTSKAVRRLVFVGAPIAWVIGSLAAHYVAGLGWPAALILSGIFVVTGPTVIMPLLRSAKLAKRPAALLRWEAIIADPLGALFAVLAFELFLVFGAGDGHHDLSDVIFRFAIAMPLGAIGGWYLGKGIAATFIRSYVPEFLKAPVILIVLLAAYVGTNAVLEEAGLLTVTAMGVAMGNTRIASLAEMRRFKEVVTVLLVSALFVILTATLEPETLFALSWRDGLYILLLLFVVRPVAVWLSTIGAGLTINERFLTSWIAPRGIVAVAVTGLFGATLSDLGNPDGERIVALAFAVVFVTVILHGFSLAPLARFLGLSSATKPGVLFVGGNMFTTEFAKELAALDVATTISDANFSHLRDARLSGIPTYFGEILSEAREHKFDVHSFGHLLSITDNDAYNALVCTEMAHEFGRSNVFQLATLAEDRHENHNLSFTVSGRRLFISPLNFHDVHARLRQGDTFQTTLITDAFDFDAYLASRDDKALVLCVVKEDQTVAFATSNGLPKVTAGDRVIAFGSTKRTSGEAQDE